MGMIELDKVQEGMVLDAPVRDPYGRILLNTGTPLQERHIEMFRRSGITEVEIVGSEKTEVDEASTIDPEVLAKSQQMMEEQFRFTDRLWNVTDEIFRLAVLADARKKMKEY